MSNNSAEGIPPNRDRPRGAALAMGFGDWVGLGLDGSPRVEDSIVWSGKRRHDCAGGGAVTVACDRIAGCARSRSEGGACRYGGHAAGRLNNYADNGISLTIKSTDAGCAGALLCFGARGNDDRSTDRNRLRVPKPLFT
jgi:hypothetical protein